MISPSVFTDGFTVPPTKVGANFKSHKWWELHWKRRTRTEAFNILDDKMRVAGAVALHNRVLEVVEEFGIDYFRKGLREIIERETGTDTEDQDSGSSRHISLPPSQHGEVQGGSRQTVCWLQ